MMRNSVRPIGLATVASALAFLTAAVFPAFPASPAFSAAGQDGPELTRTVAAEPPADCALFRDKPELDAQREDISAQLAELPVADVAAWIAGVTGPPQRIREELVRQVECLSAQVAAATDTPAGTNVVVSWRRDAAAQRSIWDSRYEFHRGRGRFGIITDASREHCGELVGEAAEWDTANDQHAQCWASLPAELKQVEILRLSTAPGTSRHHTGTEVDLFSTSPSEWADGGSRQRHHRWLQANAASYGFVQPYTPVESRPKPAIAEERWHWSYYPVSQALLKFTKEHEDAITEQHTRLWAYDPERFSYIGRHWRDYAYHVNQEPSFGSERSRR